MIGRGAVLALAFLLAGACASDDDGRPSPGPIRHEVYFRLADPALATALIEDVRRIIPRIPSVRSVDVGRRIESARGIVDSGYDVACSMSFRDESAYAAYLEHPLHLELLATWKPRFAGIRAFDWRAVAAE